jgi:hypothetical protein
LAEHILGKDEVTGSIPVMGSVKTAIVGGFQLLSDEELKTQNDKRTTV